MLGQSHRSAGSDSRVILPVCINFGFDKNCELAIRERCCGESAVLSFETQMLRSFSGKLDHPPICQIARRQLAATWKN